ncbi:MAG: hypothetical protein WCE88_04905 [Burkholderiales bacterium]
MILIHEINNVLRIIGRDTIDAVYTYNVRNIIRVEAKGDVDFVAIGSGINGLRNRAAAVAGEDRTADEIAGRVVLVGDLYIGRITATRKRCSIVDCTTGIVYSPLP